VAEIPGAFEQAILIAIVSLRDDAYGRAILKEVQERLERNVAAGAVHTTLERLERRGLLVSQLGPGTVIRSGRPRRYYRLTSAGVRAINNARTTLQTVWRGVSWPIRSRA